MRTSFEYGGSLDDEQHSDGHPPPQLRPHASLAHPGSDPLVHLERGGGVALESGRVGLTLPAIDKRFELNLAGDLNLAKDSNETGDSNLAKDSN